MRKRAQSCYEPSMVNNFGESGNEDEKDKSDELDEEDFEEPDDPNDADNNAEIAVAKKSVPVPKTKSKLVLLPSAKDLEEQEEEDPDLLEKILDALIEKHKNVTENYRKSLERVDYRTLQVEGIAAESLRQMVENAVKKVRKYRTLTEVLGEVKLNMKDVLKHPDRPRKPKSVYNFFLKEKLPDCFSRYKSHHRALTECAKTFREMTVQEKMKYVAMADEDREKVSEQLAAFKRNHPDLKKVSKGYPKGLPTDKIAEKCHGFQAYLIERAKTLGSTALTFRTVRTEWNRISVLEKYRWVHKALKTFKLHQLTDEDLEIYFGGQGLPKRPLAAYPRFVHDMSGSIDAKGPEKIKIISEMWRNTSDERKKKYFAIACKEREEWDNKCKRFLDSLSTEEKIVYKRFSLGRNIPNLPKMATRPAGAYNFFMKEQFSKYPELTANEAMKKIGAAWQLLSPEDKQKYNDLEAKAKIEFEENLINQGMPVDAKSGLADRAMLKRKPRRTKAEVALAKQKYAERGTPKVPSEKAKQTPKKSTKPVTKKKKEDSQPTSISDSDSSKKKKRQNELEFVEPKEVEGSPKKKKNRNESQSTHEPIFVEPKIPHNTASHTVSESDSPKKKKKRHRDDSQSSTTQTFSDAQPEDMRNSTMSDPEMPKKKKKRKDNEAFQPSITSTQEQPGTSHPDHIKNVSPVTKPAKPPKTAEELFMNKHYPGDMEKATAKFSRLKEHKKEKLENERQLLENEYKEQKRKYKQYLKTLNSTES